MKVILDFAGLEAKCSSSAPCYRGLVVKLGNLKMPIGLPRREPRVGLEVLLGSSLPVSSRALSLPFDVFVQIPAAITRAIPANLIKLSLG